MKTECKEEPRVFQGLAQGSGLRSLQPRYLVLVVLGLLLFNAFATRVTLPWRLGIINDEAHHHLESWRNRYRTENMNPLFLRKLEKMDRLSQEQIDLVKRVYFASPIAQRLTFVLIDPQPPLFPVMAEVIESVTHSSLVAQRIPSLLASLLSIWFIYLIGVLWRSPRTGLWMAGLMAIASYSQFYSGIARPYALAQCALVVTVYMFLLELHRGYRSPWRLLLAALFAQSSQWLLWAVVGVLVLFELVRRWRAGASIGLLIRQTWWYWFASGLLCLEMLVQLQNTVISEQARSADSGQLFSWLVSSSPFGHLQSLGPGGLWIGSFALAVSLFLGILALLRRRSMPEAATWALITAFSVSIVVMVTVGSSQRFMLSYSALMMIVGGIGLGSLFRSDRANLGLLGLGLLVFLALGVWNQSDLENSELFFASRFAEAAEQIESLLEPGDVWLAYPYHYSSPLYRYAELPEPELPVDLNEFRTALRERPMDRACLVFVHKQNLDLEELADAEFVTDYDRLVLLRLPPRGR